MRKSSLILGLFIVAISIMVTMSGTVIASTEPWMDESNFEVFGQMPKLTVLNGPRVFPVQGSRANVEFVKAVVLNGKGEVHSGFVAQRALNVLGLNQNVEFKGYVYFDEKSGLVTSGYLAHDTVLGVISDNLAVEFKGGTKVLFNRECPPNLKGHVVRGGVLDGVLAKDTTMNGQNWRSTTFKAGTKVSFSTGYPPAPNDAKPRSYAVINKY